MADELRKTIIGLIFFAMFGAIIMYIVVGFASNYGADVSQIGGGALNVTLFDNSIDDVSSNAGAYRDTFESGAVDDVDDASGIFATIKRLITMIITPFTLLGQVLANILPIPEAFINVILGALGISLIFWAWQVLRVGN